MPSLTEEYEQFKGFGIFDTYNYLYPRGKKSSDGKIIYWYSYVGKESYQSNGPTYQFNASGVTYDWLAFG